MLHNIDSRYNIQVYHDSYEGIEYFSIPLYRHGKQGYYVYFDPWIGLEIKNAFNLYAENAQHLCIMRDKWEKEIIIARENHDNSNVCAELSWFLKGGEEEGMTPLIHIPNIRTYAILNKKEYGGWTAMDYCPFCGAKFPERLDENLSEILQNEYGLESWRDYKKAPHEFWTDEWWKKRHIGPDENGL